MSKTSGFLTVTSCNGSSLSCVIPMQTLWTTPFNLVYNDTIIVQVAAVNIIGQGDWSDQV